MFTRKSINDIELHIGQKVRGLRMALGLTQKELAERLGMSFQQLQKNEKGENKISCGRLYHLSLVLGVPINYFFEGILDHCNESSSSSSLDTLESDMQLSFIDHLNDHSDLTKHNLQTLLENKEIVKVLKYYNRLQNSELRKAILSFLKLCKSCN